MPSQTSSTGDRLTAPDHLRSAARESLQIALRQAASAYRRDDFLRSFHRLPRGAVAAETPEAAAAVLKELERALRAERARAGHWTYDLSRHIGLLVAHRAEQERALRLARAARRERRARK